MENQDWPEKTDELLCPRCEWENEFEPDRRYARCEQCDHEWRRERVATPKDLEAETVPIQDLAEGTHFMYEGVLFQKEQKSAEPPFSQLARIVADQYGALPKRSARRRFGSHVRVSTSIPRSFLKHT